MIKTKSIQILENYAKVVLVGGGGGGGGGGGWIPVPSIEIIQNPSPDMKKGKIPSLEAVVP